MENLTIIHKTIQLNKKKVEVAIDIAYEYEHDQVEYTFDFGNKEENDKYLRRFETGELLNLCIRVRISALGEEGRDYLGGCHIKSNNFKEDILDLIEDHDMIDLAKEDWIKNVKNKYQELNKVLGG